MEDLVGLGKLADSKLVNAVYQDVLAPTATEVGQAGGDLTKSLRLFTAPFQYAALWQDKLTQHLDRIREGVPKERQIDARPEIAEPAIKSLIFYSEDNPALDMFENLLASEIDKEARDKVDPSMARTIQLLSASEARFLVWLVFGEHSSVSAQRSVPALRIQYDTDTGKAVVARGHGRSKVATSVFPADERLDYFRERLTETVERLTSLGVLRWSEGPTDRSYDGATDVTRLQLQLSEYGDRFAVCCLHVRQMKKVEDFLEVQSKEEV